MTDPLPSPPRVPRAWPARRLALWGALVGLLIVAQSLLVWLTISHERNRAQDQVEQAAAAAAADVRQALARHQQSLQALLWNEPAPAAWHAEATTLLRARREMLRIERRDVQMRITDAADSPLQVPLFAHFRRADLDFDLQVACNAAQRFSTPLFSRSYFVPRADRLGVEVIDLCIPLLTSGRPDGFVSATIALAQLLDETIPADITRGHELSFVEADGTRLARAGRQRGAGVYVAERLVDLAGQPLQLRLDSHSGGPRLTPNLAVALVLGLSLVLAVVVVLLARDVRLRTGAEGALAEALAFRKAMEDSLATGLRARDLSGRITYVNPAFCEMVGFSAAELQSSESPPYWPPELAALYASRQKLRLGRKAEEQTPQESREGFETTFVKRSGERISVLIFEAPLVDGSGRHTGWMSAALDISAQRRVEELARQQQERLQATARLATVGEMASLLSHELNQPLAAIASYAAGSMNLLDSHHDSADPETLPLLRQAAQRIAEQADRAGRVIKSVHDFVRRREQPREAWRVDVLIDAVLPLARLQARKSGTRIEVDLPAQPLRVVCDRTMIEQVLLNLARNGIQAMEESTALAERVLGLRVRQRQAHWVEFSVVDHGPGIPADVARRLFTPFFTTRSEGMGLGLSLCRTVIEQHGGVLDFQNLESAESARGVGTEFRFTLPAEAADAAKRTRIDSTEATESTP
jgi:two-component system, LuxR family, sensor histidine kinase DctS